MREFFISRGIFALTVFFLMLGCSHTANKNSESTASEPPLKIIDAHTHTNFDGKPEESSGIPYSLESFLEEMKKAGVVGAVSHNNRAGKPQADLRKYGVVHCGAIVGKVNKKEVEENLKSGRWNCLKIYLGYLYHFAYDPIYQPAYKLAEKYQVPVVFHTGDTYSSDGLLKYTDPMTIDEVAVKNRGVNFIIAHMGNPWIQTAAEVAYKNPNVYLEASALMIGELHKTAPEDLQEYLVRPIKWAYGYIEDPKKFLYGSDWPLVSMSTYVEAYKKAIPKEHWNLVFYENAARLFKIKAPEAMAQ